MNPAEFDRNTILISSNVVSVTVGVTKDSTNSAAVQYELVAPVKEGFTFLYWIDANTEQVLSSELTYSFVATADQEIQAIYELNQSTEPTLFYERNLKMPQNHLMQRVVSLCLENLGYLVMHYLVD